MIQPIDLVGAALTGAIYTDCLLVFALRLAADRGWPITSVLDPS